MGIIALINAIFVGVWYKELKITTFDPALAKALGFSPVLMHYMLMGVTSVTCVGAFDVVGSILVVSLMITPPATAYLLTESLVGIIGLSMGFGILSSIVGYFVASVLDASIAGAIASVSGVFFLIALFLSPQQGILFKYFRRQRQRTDFSIKMLLVQLLSHEGTDLEAEENTIDNMIQHMGWEPVFVRRILRVALERHCVVKNDDLLSLTPLGREMAKSAMQMT
jgi:manganese/zinc/iron transport system permease protein